MKKPSKRILCDNATRSPDLGVRALILDYSLQSQGAEGSISTDSHRSVSPAVRQIQSGGTQRLRFSFVKTYGVLTTLDIIWTQTERLPGHAQERLQAS